MRKTLTLFLCCLLLAGCSSKRIPDWIYAGSNQLEDFKKSYLAGDEKIAALHFTKATEAIKKSGNPEILARAYLIKQALQTATLESVDDGMYLSIAAIQSTPENSAFYHFLKGSFDQVEARSLPEQYRRILEALREQNKAAMTAETVKIDDPLSRLIAAGIIIRYREYDEALLQAAVDTASANGWKKPLLVYLEKLADFYTTNRDMGRADNVRKRIEMMQ